MAAIDEVVIHVRAPVDVETARRAARTLGEAIGFDGREKDAIALAVSELAVNLVRYADSGQIHLRRVQAAGRTGIEVESTDLGPGIPDLERALEDGFSTGGGLGGGLGAVRRLMDDLEAESTTVGTRVLARKWLTGRFA